MEESHLLQMGLIDSTIVASLLDFPDADSVSNPIKADFELIEQQLARMLEDGKAQQLPDPRQNLQRALAYGTFCYLRARIDDAPQERLDLVNDYLSAIEDLIAQATPLAPPV